MASMGSLTADMRLNSAAFIRDVGRATAAIQTSTAQMRRHMRSVEQATRGMERQMLAVRSAVNSVGFAIAALGIGAFVRDIVRTSAEFQRLQASLKTVTGSSEAAAAAFAAIKQFAATTPFDLQQVTAGFIKLKALGLDPSMESLRSYGNTASAMGKELNQFIEAVADAATGEFERLKEFGVRAKSEGDKVTFTFQNQATTVGKNAREIEQYLRRIGEVQFAGAMEEQSRTLGGALSNLGDAFAVFQNEVGEGGLAQAVADIARDMATASSESHGFARNLGSALAAALRAVAEAAAFAARHLAEIVAVFAAFAAARVAGMFIAIGGAVIGFAKAVRAAAAASALLDVVVSRSVLGALAKLAAAGTIAALTWSEVKDAFEEAGAAIEEASGSFGTTGGSGPTEVTIGLTAERRAVLELIDALEHERMAIGLTNTEREVANNVRQAGVAATAEEIAKIASLTSEIEMLNEAQDIANSGIKTFVHGLIEGKSATEALQGALGQLANSLVDKSIDTLVGAIFSGFSGGPTSIVPPGIGGGIGSLVGSLFGGFRAAGGPVSPGRAYVVGEREPEIFVPRQSGYVTPAGGVQATAAPPIVNHFHGPIDGSMRAYIAREIALSEQRTRVAVLGDVAGRRATRPTYLGGA